jgi:hypothetical protein
VQWKIGGKYILVDTPLSSNSKGFFKKRIFQRGFFVVMQACGQLSKHDERQFVFNERACPYVADPYAFP